jgi:hypothetical protein
MSTMLPQIFLLILAFLALSESTIPQREKVKLAFQKELQYLGDFKFNLYSKANVRLVMVRI